MGETCPVSELDTMMPTPTITLVMAAQVATPTGSRNSTKAINAASSGTPACISKILATVVWASATTNAVDAVAKHSATQTPGKPMDTNNCRVPAQPSRLSMKPARKTAALRERQKITVQLSVTLK